MVDSIAFVRLHKSSNYVWHIVPGDVQVRVLADPEPLTQKDFVSDGVLCSRGMQYWADYTNLPFKFPNHGISTAIQEGDKLCLNCSHHDEQAVELFERVAGKQGQASLHLRGDLAETTLMQGMNDPEVLIKQANEYRRRAKDLERQALTRYLVKVREALHELVGAAEQLDDTELYVDLVEFSKVFDDEFFNLEGGTE